MKCGICEKDFRNKTCLSNHIKVHSISKKEYYDNYLKTKEEGFCKTCGEETTLESISKGYHDYCSKECISSNPEIILRRLASTNMESFRKKISDTKLSEEYKKKLIESMQLKYGVDHVSQLASWKQKVEETMMSKYGSKQAFSVPEIREKAKQTMIARKDAVPEERYGDFLVYSKKVKFLTEKNRKILLENWDGIDFYDKEYIKENFRLESHHRNYPTIDHKKSVMKCFLEEDTIEFASSLQNLCFTKKWINSSKSFKTKSETDLIVEKI